MTIYDIAEMAGISATTVSRVINDKPGVKAETRKKVKKLLDEYEFQLNENARGLSTNVTKFIGIMIADIRNMHYTEVAYVIESQLLNHEYCSIILNAGNEPKLMEYSIQILKQRNVDGVVIIGSIFQNDYVKKAIEKHLPEVPIVFANGYINLPNVYGALVDEYQGVRDCVELLYQRGYSHIAFAGGLHTSSNRLKAGGYESAMVERGNEIIKIELLTNTFAECDYQPLHDLLSRYPYVDGVIFSNDYLAGEATHYFRERQISIPDQLGIIGINNSRFCQIATPKITSLDNKMPELGFLVTEILLDLLSGKKKIKKIMIFPEIVERDSVRL